MHELSKRGKTVMYRVSIPITTDFSGVRKEQFLEELAGSRLFVRTAKCRAQGKQGEIPERFKRTGAAYAQLRVRGRDLGEQPGARR